MTLRQFQPSLGHLRPALVRLRRLAVSTPVFMAGEAVVVFCATVVGALLLHVVTVGGFSPLHGQATPVLGATTAGAVAVVAVLCALNARLTDDPGMRLTSYAWGFYALVGMPVSVVNSAPGSGPLVRGAAVATTAVFGLLLALGLAERVPRWWSGTRAIAGGVVLTLLAITAAAVLPAGLDDVVDSYVAEAVLLAGWGLLACICVTRGLRRRSATWWRMGYGLVLICAARALVLFSGTPVEFVTLRFIGVLVLLAAMGLRTRVLLIERRAAESEAAERAAADERAAAERRHEIRNALFALSSVTTMMTPRPDADAVVGGRSISAMIDDEFARLQGLLERTSPSADEDVAAVDPVLTRLVTLRRLSGADITLQCPPGMRVTLPTATLAQVVTNLLANCARHAPGARVFVGAYRDAACCVIEITDAGPGLDPAATTVGDGIGLALSARLVEACGGSLELRTASRFVTGTTVLLRLPVVVAGAVRHLTVAPATGKLAS